MHHSELIDRSRLGGAALACAALGSILAAGCGAQAGEDYLGEPLLQVRGEAVVAALTGGQAVEPALCFRRQTDQPVDLSGLPPEVMGVFALPSDLEQAATPIDMPPPLLDEAHIVSVESRGEFPSQFEVAVYVPPPDAVATSSVEGEPRKAVGEVCAVLPGYGPTTYQLAVSGSAGYCGDTECGGRLALASADGERAYAKAYRCPAGVPFYDPSQCTETSAGDETLLLETYAEGVVGAARDPLIVYLADAAPAGGFTAWELGASDGLSAGYHVFVAPTPDEQNARAACKSSMNEAAYAAVDAEYGERLRADYGDDYALWPPYVGTPDGSTIALQRVPDDLLAGINRVLAEQEMANCPIPELTELDPLADEIALTIDVYEEAFRGWPGNPKGTGGPTIP